MLIKSEAKLLDFGLAKLLVDSPVLAVCTHRHAAIRVNVKN